MDLADKTCLVTGANSGLGFATAKQFAGSGANVVLVCRDSSKGKAAMEEIKKEVPGAKLELMICDLTSSQSIRNFIGKFKETHSNLNILFHNAAVIKKQRTITEDGFETMFQTNYLAPVILTTGLLDVLKNSSPARIINIAVPPEKLCLNFEDLQSAKQFKSFDAFMRTKLYLLLYSVELSRRLTDTGVIVSSIAPGPFKSELGREFPWVFRKMMGLLSMPADKAAGQIVSLASAFESRANSGKVYNGKEEKPLLPYWEDTGIRERLWSVTESLAKQFNCC